MTSFEERPGDVPAHEIDDSKDTLALKEVLSMLAELKGEEAEVLRIIEEVLAEPIPDLHDEQAKIEFREKMKAIRVAAATSRGRTDLLRSIEERIRDNLAQIEDNPAGD